MFDGYLSLGGQEILNSQRTKAYADHLLPQFTLREGCCACDTLAEYLGDAPYTTPLQDQAPWVSLYRQESTEFLGLVPLSLEGFDDSTIQTPYTEVTGDGGVAGRSRRASRELRGSALMLATTEKGMTFGMSWLRDALFGEPCTTGDCSGTSLCYLASCPDLCDDDLAVDVLDQDFRALSEAEAAPLVAQWESNGGTISWINLGGVNALRFRDLPPNPEASILVSGLTPGATYRVDVATLGGVDTSAGRRMEVQIAGLPGTLVRTPRTIGASGAPDTTGAVFEFTALESTHRLVLRPFDIVLDPTADATRLYLTVASITRVARPSILMGGPITSETPGSMFPWEQVGVPITNITRAWNGVNGFNATATGAASAGPNLLGMYREVTGLIPGRRYRFRLGVMQERNTDPSTVSIISVQIDGIEVNVVSDSTWTGLTQGEIGWVTAEFVATDTFAQVALLNAETQTFVSTDYYHTQVVYMRLEEDITGEEILPVLDPSHPLRTLQNVTTTSGPRVTRTFPQRNGGILQQVEWTMVATTPRPIGEAVHVTTTLGMDSIVVPEIECSDGQQVLQNLFTNSSFELATTGWSVVAGDWTLTRVVSAFATSGTYVGRIGATAPTVTQGILNSAAMALTQMSAYTFSVTAGSEVAARVFLRHTKDGISTDSPYVDLVPDEVQTLSLSFYVSPYGSGSSTLTVIADGPGGGTMASGEFVDVDSLMLTQTPAPSFFVSGEIPGGTWDGTAWASTATWRKPVVALVTDPDCPPPPAPPRPPIVVDDCILPPDQWVRHAISIPAEITQRAPGAYPSITLTTGIDAARGVRARLYANPFSRPPEQMDPCDYCGEFLLSYLPPNAALNIDASTRSATVVVGGESQPAMQLLYGTDGLPVTWPEMTCGVPYVLMVDLDASTSPLVGLDLDVYPAY